MDEIQFDAFRKIIESSGYLVDDFDDHVKISIEGPTSTAYSVNVSPPKAITITVLRKSTGIKKTYDKLLPQPWTKYFEQDLKAGVFGKP